MPVASRTLLIVEQVADGEAPTRDDILGIERVFDAEDDHRLLQPMDRHNLPPGIDDEHDERSVLQPLRDLLVYLGVKIVRRDDLDGQIRRPATVVSSWYPGRLKPFTSDEGDVRRP